MPNIESPDGIDPAPQSTTTSLEVAIGYAGSAHKRNGSGYVQRVVIGPDVRCLPSRSPRQSTA